MKQLAVLIAVLSAGVVIAAQAEGPHADTRRLERSISALESKFRQYEFESRKFAELERKLNGLERDKLIRLDDSRSIEAKVAALEGKIHTLQQRLDALEAMAGGSSQVSQKLSQIEDKLQKIDDVIGISGSAVTINASQLTVNAGSSKFSGTVQSDTLITNSVISSSYTPGAGNVW